MSALLTMAIGKDGSLVHVDSVEKGLRCGCFCPHCKAPLYAKNGGAKREHHFAHAKGKECENAYETALHMLAKEVIRETGVLTLPKYYAEGYPTGLVWLKDIQVEKKDETWGFVPDAEGLMENGERLLIEFFVSHKVDQKKRQIILENGLKCVQLDINSVELDRIKMKYFLFDTTDNREWITPAVKVGHKEDASLSYGRNPAYFELRDHLKQRFEDGQLFIQPDSPRYPQVWLSYGFNHDVFQRNIYNLKKMGYDSCLVGRKYRGLNTDLLLFRSNKEGDAMGHIAICIRGRRRNFEFKYPSGLRVIDIILRNGCDLSDISKVFPDGVLSSTQWAIDVEYVNFKINNTR